MSSSATLYYPDFDGMSRLDENVGAPLLPQTISEWEFNYAEYENTATVTISLESKDDSYGDIVAAFVDNECRGIACLLYTSPSPRDRTRSRMPSSA